MNVAEIKASIAKYERSLASAVAPDEVAFAKKKLAKAKEELAEAEKKTEKKGAVKKTEPDKKIIPAKIKVDKPVKSGRVLKIGDKIYNEKDKDFCTALLKTWKERLEAREKSQRKYKTVSVSSRIGKDSAHAIIKAIDEVSAEKIGHNPKVFISLVETSGKKRLEYIESLERIVKFGGGHLNKTELKAEMDSVHEMIEKIKAKIKAKK